MTSIGIDDLKKRLSEVIRKAEAGDKILITRHNRPVVQLTAAATPNSHRGRRFGQGKLKPALQEGSGGAYLEVLEEDRGS